MEWSVKGITFINQWKLLNKFRIPNEPRWAEFTLIYVNFELAEYAKLGKAIEFTLIFFGFGVLLELYTIHIPTEFE